MDRRGFVVMAGAVALVAPLTGWTSMPVAASGTSGVSSAAVPASTCFPQTDNGDPVLKAFDFAPRAVDSRSGAQTMTFTATAEDTGGPGAPSGVVRGNAYVYYDDGNPWNWNLVAPLRPSGQGSLTGTLTILPQFKSGTRWVSVSLEDAAGNSTMYTFDDLAEMGLPTTFTAATNPDHGAPTVRSVYLSSPTIDTRRHPSRLTVRIRATDDSGIATMRVWLWGSPVRSSTAHPRLVQGTRTNGTWQGRIRVPRWQGSSTAKLAIELTDVVGRFRTYGPKTLAAIDQPGTVRIVSRPEPAPPTLRLRSVVPRSLDLRTGEHSVTVVVRVTDRGSGVRGVSLSLYGPESGNGAPSVDARLRRVSGTVHDGVWRGTATLRVCDAAPGTWHLIVSASDAANGDYVSVPEALTVLNADILRPTVSVAGDSYEVRRTGPLEIEFNEDVVGVNADNALVHVGDNRRGLAGDDPPPVAGTWACQAASGAAVDCTAGPVRTAAFTPAAPMLAGTNHSLVLNPEHHLGLTDLAGNPFGPGGAVSFRTS